jgi:hypothetical protein
MFEGVGRQIGMIVNASHTVADKLHRPRPAVMGNQYSMMANPTLASPYMDAVWIENDYFNQPVPQSNYSYTNQTSCWSKWMWKLGRASVHEQKTVVGKWYSNGGYKTHW